MDVNTFSADLLQALTESRTFERIDLGTEGPIVDGYIYIQSALFVRFYFNERTQTIAFALIKDQQRIWGIDRDRNRGWHLHPLDNPKSHLQIEPLSVADIVVRLCEVVAVLV